MHLPDGLLPPSWWIPGWGVSGVWLALNLRQIQASGDPSRQIPKASLLTAAFFLASTLHLPIPPTSVHLVLNGFLGVILGVWTLPAVTVGLMLQAITFGHGGLTTLGLNILIMGIPGVAAGWLYRQGARLGKAWVGGWAFLAGALGLGGAVILFWGTVVVSLGDGLGAGTEQVALQGLVLAHIPLMLLEGGITAAAVVFVRRVKPELIP